jgi:hypothetical protein
MKISFRVTDGMTCAGVTEAHFIIGCVIVVMEISQAGFMPPCSIDKWRAAPD